MWKVCNRASCILAVLERTLVPAAAELLRATLSEINYTPADSLHVRASGDGFSRVLPALRLRLYRVTIPSLTAINDSEIMKSLASRAFLNLFRRVSGFQLGFSTLAAEPCL